MDTTFIYALADPRDDAIRYVGKSNAPKTRYRRHVTEPPKTHRACWIQGLRAIGLKPTLLILEEVPRAGWQAYECAWIQKLKSEGCLLTNLTDGGEGCEHNAETRAKMRAAKVGKPAHNRGKPASEDARRKQSEAAKRRWARMTPEELAAATKHIREGPKKGYPGWHHTDEARAKISEAGRGRHASEETRRKLSASLKRSRAVNPILHAGHSTETRRKISEAQSRLSAEQLAQIRVLIARGDVSGKSIAEQFGITRTLVSRIKHGKSYRDYSDPHHGFAS